MGQSNGVDLLYEGSENFGALTSFGVIPAMGGLSGLITGKVPGLHIDLSKVSIFHIKVTMVYLNQWFLNFFLITHLNFFKR